MPATFAGAERRLPRYFGGAAGVDYGRGNDAPVAWVMQSGKQVPDADRSGEYDPDGGWWFACTIDGAEGAPNFTGQAVGWAVGDLGWLTITPDRATSRALLKAMREAAAS